MLPFWTLCCICIVLNKAKPVLTFYHCVMLQSTSFYKKYFNHFGMMIIVIVLTIALILLVIKLFDNKIEKIKQSNSKQIIFNTSKDNFFRMFQQTNIFYPSSNHSSSIKINQLDIYETN